MRIWARLLADEGQGRNPYRFEQVEPNLIDSDGYLIWGVVPGGVSSQSTGAVACEVNNAIGLGGLVVPMEKDEHGVIWLFQCQRDVAHNGGRG